MRQPDSPPPKSLEAYAEEQAAVKFSEHQELARNSRVIKAQNEKLAKEVSSLKERLGVYESLDTSTINPPAWLSPKRSSNPHVAIPSLLLTDIHWDEIVFPEQIDGLNKYNREIAQERIRRAITRSIKVAFNYLGGVSYEGFQLWLGGDLLSGIIHEELRENNQATVIEGVLSIIEPLVAGINLLTEAFGRVNITAVVGNHGRRTQKPVAKNRAQDNFDWLVYKLLQKFLKGREEITMKVSEAADAHEKLYDVKYLLTHGDQFKGGSGISAALAPLLLGTHRKTRRQIKAGKPYDVMVMGHFHTSIWMPSKGLIVGGSVIGYNEYAYQQNLEPEEPQCAFWLTTPEKGITASVPIFVSDRVEEGW